MSESDDEELGAQRRRMMEKVGCMVAIMRLKCEHLQTSGAALALEEDLREKQQDMIAKEEEIWESASKFADWKKVNEEVSILWVEIEQLMSIKTKNDALIREANEKSERAEIELNNIAAAEARYLAMEGSVQASIKKEDALRAEIADLQSKLSEMEEKYLSDLYKLEKKNEDDLRSAQMVFQEEIEAQQKRRADADAQVKLMLVSVAEKTAAVESITQYSREMEEKVIELESVLSGTNAGDAEARFQALEKSVLDRTLETQVLLTKLKDLEIRNADLERELVLASATSEILENTKKSLEVERKEKRELEGRCENLEKSVGDKMLETMVLMEKTNNLESKVRQLEMSLAEKTEELGKELMKGGAGYREETERLKGEKERLEGELREWREKCDRLQGEKEAAEEERDQWKSGCGVFGMRGKGGIKK